MTGEAGPGTEPPLPSVTELVIREVVKGGMVVPRGYEPHDCEVEGMLPRKPSTNRDHDVISPLFS